MPVLAFLTRHVTVVMAAGIFLGIALPALASVAAPLLTPAVVVLLTAALVRLNWAEVASLRKRPVLIAALFVWVLAITPAVMTSVLVLFPVPGALESAIVLSAACPPIMSSIALALIFRLNAALIVVVVFGTILLVPFTLPPMALLLLGLELQIDLVEFMARLGAITLGSMLLAGVIVRIFGREAIDRNADGVDGISVVMLLVFAVAIMDGVTGAIVERPAYVGLTLAAAFGVNIFLQLLAGGAFFWLGRWQAVSIALASGNRNMGLLLAALAGSADFDMVLFFALGQIPIYVLPILLKPLYLRLSPSSAPDDSGPSRSPPPISS